MSKGSTKAGLCLVKSREEELPIQVESLGSQLQKWISNGHNQQLINDFKSTKQFQDIQAELRFLEAYFEIRQKQKSGVPFIADLLKDVFKAGGFAPSTNPMYYSPSNDYCFQYNLHSMDLVCKKMLFVNLSPRKSSFELSEHLHVKKGKVCIPDLYPPLMGSETLSILMWQVVFKALDCTNCADYAGNILSTIMGEAEQKKIALQSQVNSLEQEEQNEAELHKWHAAYMARKAAQEEIQSIEYKEQNIRYYSSDCKPEMHKKAQEIGMMMHQWKVKLTTPDNNFFPVAESKEPLIEEGVRELAGHVQYEEEPNAFVVTHQDTMQQSSPALMGDNVSHDG